MSENSDKGHCGCDLTSNTLTPDVGADAGDHVPGTAGAHSAGINGEAVGHAETSVISAVIGKLT